MKTVNYVPRLYDFLRRVEVNNNRPWFKEHKSEFDDLRQLWLADVDRLIAAMGEWEPALRGQDARSSAYRFYRDTRFSTDKSPYKTFFSALISPWGRKTERACWYLEMGPAESESGLFGGLWMPAPAVLNKLRHAIVDNIEEFEEIVSEPGLLEHFPEWFTNGALKTIPKGWPRTHPQAEFLRLRHYGRCCPLDEAFFSDPDWPVKAAELMKLLKPLIDFLNYSIDEDVSF